jgi:hypothetical protein
VATILSLNKNFMKFPTRRKEALLFVGEVARFME